MAQKQQSPHAIAWKKFIESNEGKAQCDAITLKIETDLFDRLDPIDTGGMPGIAYPRRTDGGGMSVIYRVELLRRAIRFVCPPGGRVGDPFAGIGSTAVAAIAEGCSFWGSELDPRYAKLSKQRIAISLQERARTLRAARTFSDVR